MKRLTKKDLALSLHDAGRTNAEIASALETSVEYIENILAARERATRQDPAESAADETGLVAELLRLKKTYDGIDFNYAADTVSVIISEFAAPYEARRIAAEKRVVELEAVLRRVSEWHFYTGNCDNPDYQAMANEVDELLLPFDVRKGVDSEQS